MSCHIDVGGDDDDAPEISLRDDTPDLSLPREGGRIVHDISLQLLTTSDSVSLTLDVDGAFNEDGTEQDSVTLLKVALEPR
jgi:hypothetical protein